ncbi:MAG: MFS transporter [Variibacter sp.]|nr:MFS transporter [Variibacter sp.]
MVFGTLLPVFLGSLDLTILAGALPTIGQEIGHVGDLPWLITAYLLAGTAMTPLLGKISDIRGRRYTLSIAILLYIAGSFACAVAPNFLVLVLGRAVQGIGGGGLTALSMVVLGDIASPKDRGKYYAWFSATYTAAGALGPLLGGVIAEHLHWSMIFWMNVPLGLLALGIVSTVLRRLPRHERPHQLDLVGAALIVVASASFMLMLNIGGVRAPWTSTPVLLLLALAALTGVAFALRLLRAPEPLIPLSILRSAEARCAIGLNAFAWGAIIALNIYLPAYLQTVLGFSASHAGLSLMILMVTVNTSAGFNGQIIGRVVHYKRLPVLGLAVTVAAMCTLAWQAETMTFWRFQLILAVIGIGFGPVAPLSTVVLQNSVAIHQFGTAVGTMNFSRSLYATMLVAVFGVIVLAGASAIAPGQTATALTAASFSYVFFAVAFSMTMALVSLLLMREKPLQTRE